MLPILPPPAPVIQVQGRALSPDVPTPLVEARPLALFLRGFKPGSLVTVTATRRLSRWRDNAGTWKQETVRMVSWAEVRCGRDGSVEFDRTRLLSGSFARSGGAGLFWSGYVEGDAKIPAGLDIAPPDEPKNGETVLAARAEDGSVTRGTVRPTDPPGVTVVPIATKELNGCFAAPANARRLPTVISLHGSEGGSAESARARAIQFASRGFATLAVNYFAYPHMAIPDLAQSNLNTPVELLENARSWLSRRPEADGRRLGLYGVSKGAEFALVGASTFPWVRAAVGNVPSDVVWEGYPTPPRTGRESTWSFRGEPLPYIPLYDPDPRFRVNTDRYERSREDRPEAARAAIIPVERTRAHLLLIGSDRDEVWASGKMARSVAARMRRFGKGSRVEAHVYPMAGHQISGPGLFPVRLYGVPSEDARDKSLDAEGEATVDAWRRTVSFFERRL